MSLIAMQGAMMTAGGGGGGSDPYFSSVVSLLHLDGTDASTTITDVTGRSWTAFDGAQIDTDQSVSGGASLYLPRSGGARYIRTASDSSLNLATSDFTIEGWARLASLPGGGDYRFIFARDNVSIVRGWLFFIDGDAGGKLTFSANNTDSTVAQVVAPSSFPVNTWVHVAVSKIGGTIYLSQAGTIVASTSTNVSGKTITDIASGVYAGVGLNSNTPFDPFRWDGWLDEMRITIGVGRYSSDFTPETRYPDS